MYRRVGLVVGALAVLSVLSMGCGSKPVVGVLLPSTGEAGTYGESIESGVRLAISDARDREELPPWLVDGILEMEDVIKAYYERQGVGDLYEDQVPKK